MGILTARDGAAVNLFWDRIEKLHRQGLANRKWVATSVAEGGLVSTRMENAIGGHQQAAGFTGPLIYFGVQTADPNVLDFVATNLTAFESASVISMTGNGDPQGIWLFEGNRNLDRSKHWRYDPAKVGHDPNQEMVCITAEHFRQLTLNSPIIWSGTCRSGACLRVFVEADIASTFGWSDCVEMYELDLTESLSLAWIDAGAAALLVPIASNHGMSTMMEQQFALLHGATLGDAMKSTDDDVFFQTGGPPKLNLTKVGDSADGQGPLMQGSGANCILIGDPALKPFAATPVPGESTTVSFDVAANSLTAIVRWQSGFQVTGWNMYGEDRAATGRINTRIPLTGELQTFLRDVATEPQVMVSIQDDSKNEIPCRVSYYVEEFGGERYLHLQATMSREISYECDFEANFTIGVFR